MGSQGIVDWVEKHPRAKLGIYGAAILGFALSGGSSVATVLAYQHQSERDAKEDSRAGLDVDPPANLFFSGDNCQFRNDHNRPLVEVSMHFGDYLVDLTDKHRIVGSGGVKSTPEKREREVAPGDWLRADLPEHQQRHSCYMNECPEGHRCIVMRECLARYHRDGDRQPYDKTAFAFVEQKDGKSVDGKDCSVVPLDNVVKFGRVAEGRIGITTWTNADYQAVWKLTEEDRRETHNDQTFRALDDWSTVRIAR